MNVIYIPVFTPYKERNAQCHRFRSPDVIKRHRRDRLSRTCQLDCLKCQYRTTYLYINVYTSHILYIYILHGGSIHITVTHTLIDLVATAYAYRYAYTAYRGYEVVSELCTSIILSTLAATIRQRILQLYNDGRDNGRTFLRRERSVTTYHHHRHQHQASGIAIGERPPDSSI